MANIVTTICSAPINGKGQKNTIKNPSPKSVKKRHGIGSSGLTATIIVNAVIIIPTRFWTTNPNLTSIGQILYFSMFNRIRKLTKNAANPHPKVKGLNTKSDLYFFSILYLFLFHFFYYPLFYLFIYK